jgi:hypothetical protein
VSVYTLLELNVAEAMRVNDEGIRDADGATEVVVPVQFPGLGWGLMLSAAAAMVTRLYPELNGGNG